MHENFKVTFTLDGSGVAYDPHEPTHLDSLVGYCRAAELGLPPPLGDEAPAEFEIPLAQATIRGETVYRASALIPSEPDAPEDTIYWRKRLRQARVEVAKGSPNLTNGLWRDWQMPLHLMLIRELVAYGRGEVAEVRRLLRTHIRHIGKKRSQGHGRVSRITVERCEQDWGLLRDGCAMRWLPAVDLGSARLSRLQPPYWHSWDRVPVCEVGELYPLEG